MLGELDKEPIPITSVWLVCEGLSEVSASVVGFPPPTVDTIVVSSVVVLVVPDPSSVEVVVCVSTGGGGGGISVG